MTPGGAMTGADPLAGQASLPTLPVRRVVYVGAPQRGSLIDDTVLTTDHRDLVAVRGAQVLERATRVL